MNVPVYGHCNITNDVVELDDCHMCNKCNTEEFNELIQKELEEYQEQETPEPPAEPAAKPIASEEVRKQKVALAEKLFNTKEFDHDKFWTYYEGCSLLSELTNAQLDKAIAQLDTKPDKAKA